MPSPAILGKDEEHNEESDERDDEHNDERSVQGGHLDKKSRRKGEKLGKQELAMGVFVLPFLQSYNNTLSGYLHLK